MEAVASSLTATATVVDIKSDNLNRCNNRDENEESNSSVKNSEDEYRNYFVSDNAIFANVGESLDMSKKNDVTGNSRDINDINVEIVDIECNDISIGDAHGGNSRSFHENDCHSNDVEILNNLNEDSYSIDNIRDKKSNVSVSSLSIGSVSTTSINSNKRISKRCTEIAERSRLVPNTNIDSFDFDKEVIELRGLYRLSGSTVGLFRPLSLQDNMKQNITVSNEW